MTNKQSFHNENYGNVTLDQTPFLPNVRHRLGHAYYVHISYCRVWISVQNYTKQSRSFWHVTGRFFWETNIHRGW